MKRTILSAIACTIFSLCTIAQIGTWKAYPAYHNITDIQPAGNIVYVLASGGLYAYNKNDNSIQTFDKSTVLSDVDINYITYNSTAKRLLIIYKNHNIDLLDLNGNVTNISDYYSKTIIGDKTINHIYIDGNYAYLSTAFGIIKLNVRDAEISDTYTLGFNVNWTYTENGKIVAESASQGKYTAPLNANLLDRNNWKRTGEYTPYKKTTDEELKREITTLLPGGPKYNHFYFMKHQNDRLYTAGGLFESGGTALNLPGIVQVLRDDDWVIYQDDIQPTTGYSYSDINCVAINPKNPEHVFAGGRTGLYEFVNGKLKTYYNKDNSILLPAMDRGKELGNDYVVINGLVFDEKGSLWILNNQTKGQTIVELLPDGSMKSHHQPSLMKNGVSPSVLINPMFDSRGLLWFGNADYKYPGLFCYQPSTQKFYSFTKFVNQDGVNLSPTSIKYVAEDLENNIWIGTNTGLLMLESSQTENLTDAVFTQIKVARNDGTSLADYLLANVHITSIVVDKSNRKWIGTGSNGVYLISADNQTQVYHFTAENSKLLSNYIESIAINDKTGEVFFGTNKGLCSFMSDATESVEKMDKNVTYAYPNPVEPAYNGSITIVGLTYNADIKIVTASGQLVARGKSNGGTFVWNGTDLNGKPVASGIYMVQTADKDGNKGTVCKIAIVR